MDDIKVIKKAVAPAACWFTIKPLKTKKTHLQSLRLSLTEPIRTYGLHLKIAVAILDLLLPSMM